MNATALVGFFILGITVFLTWAVNRDKKAGWSKRWPPTFGVTLLGGFFGVLMVVFSLRLPDETLGAAAEVFAVLWIIYLVVGSVACGVAWTHSGRVERKAFRESLAEGLPVHLPMVTAQRLATRVGIICFALIFVALLVVILSQDPTASKTAPLEMIMAAGIYPSMVVVALVWWIQTRRVKRRDEDYRTAQERQIERLAQENSAAYRNGFDDGQTAVQ